MADSRIAPLGPHQTLFQPVFKANPSLQLSLRDSESARIALLKFRNNIEISKPTKFMLDGEIRVVGALLGKGNSKSIYDIGNNQVIAIPNSSYDYTQLDLKAYKKWCAVVEEESLMATSLQKVGLRVLAIKSSIIQFENESLLVMIAPSFASLEEIKGMQISDHRSGRAGTGNSMLFGTVKNLMNIDHLHALFTNIIQDVAVLIAHELAFEIRDAYNLVIEDTLQTPHKESPEYAADTHKLYSERHQKIRLFFYDLTGAKASTKFEAADITNISVDLSNKRIIAKAEFCLSEACVALYAGLTRYERLLFKKCGANFAERTVRANFLLIKSMLLDEVCRAVTKQLRKAEPVQSDDGQNLEPELKKRKF